MIEVVSYEFLPRDEFDGRKIHYYFRVHGKDKQIKENYAYAVISGTLIGMWSSYFQNAKTHKEFEEALAKLILKIIEQEVKDFSEQGILSSTPLTFKYWSENAPTINFDIKEVESIEGYTFDINN